MHYIGEVANLRVKLLGLRPSSLSQDKEKIRSARKIPPNGKPMWIFHNVIVCAVGKATEAKL
jgi:DNA-binding transcriptional regulator YdaS (Cro superfamily)